MTHDSWHSQAVVFFDFSTIILCSHKVYASFQIIDTTKDGTFFSESILILYSKINSLMA